MTVGKIYGAVGTYAHTPPAIEAYVCDRLGIGIEPASSQITHRDRHAEFLATLALIGASLERFATEIRHLQRSEVGEARESFGKGQKGSSAMPHKRNPIASENVTGLARLLRGYAVAGFEDVALWHERDISHSSVERVALPDACQILDFAIVRMTRLIRDLEVDAARMRHNLEAERFTRGHPRVWIHLEALERSPTEELRRTCKLVGLDGRLAMDRVEEVVSKVYSRDLNQDGNFPTSEGVAGSWTIRVVLTKAVGGLNFRAEKP